MIIEIKPNALRRMNRSIRLVYGSASVATKERIIDRIMDAIETLSAFPRGGALEPDLTVLQMGHRRLIVGKFKVIYRVTKDRIIIVDIFDARQDPRKMRP